MRAILVITSSMDVTVDYVIMKYHNDALFYRLNVDELSKYKINIGGKNQWTITCEDWALEKAGLYSIYYRKPILPDLSEYEKEYHGMIAKDIISLINGIADDFEGKVLTSPAILRKTENKTYQLLYAIRNGISIPESYIGNCEEDTLKYIEGKSIIKPLTTGKLKVCDGIEMYQTNYFNDLSEDIRLTPLYIQNYEEKQYEIRLTYINGNIFAVRLDSEDKLDWRKNYSGLKYSIVECPENVIIWCKKLMEDFELKFGAFDFIVNKSDEWIFLEVNPNGQWLWLEKILDIPISECIFKYLVD